MSKQAAAGIKVSISLRLCVYLSVSLNIVYLAFAFRTLVLQRPDLFLLAYTISA